MQKNLRLLQFNSRVRVDSGCEFRPMIFDADFGFGSNWFMILNDISTNYTNHSRSRTYCLPRYIELYCTVYLLYTVRKGLLCIVSHRLSYRLFQLNGYECIILQNFRKLLNGNTVQRKYKYCTLVIMDSCECKFKGRKLSFIYYYIFFFFNNRVFCVFRAVASNIVYQDLGRQGSVALLMFCCGEQFLL